MLSRIVDVQKWLRRSSLAGLLIPSTDEFISEFAPPASRRLRWVTGFRGSVGTALILRERAALFLDGRYQLQGAEDTQGTGIVIQPATLPARSAWLRDSLNAPARIGVDPWLHSVIDMSQWRSVAAELGIALEPLTTNPIDELWSANRPVEHRPPIVDYPTVYAGEPYEAKCAALVEYVRASRREALLLADPEDVSWLLNVRAAAEAVKTEVGDLHIVPSCISRALVRRDGCVTWFVERERLAREVLGRGEGVVTLAAPGAIMAAVREAATQGPIGFDPRRTPAALATIIEECGSVCHDDTAARRRWRKHGAEVDAARRAHITDAVAVVRFMAWVVRTVAERRVSEFEAAQVLESFRAERHEYKGASMPMMSASGPSCAQPHYVPRRVASRWLNDHPIFWMDSGGQYLGGSTDNTITLALGVPEPKHVLAHTLVLQGYIALAMTRFPFGTHALRLDTIARQMLWREGMDFPHNTGHGVGNYLNIHEGPLIGREPGPTTTVPLEPGMIVTNEPAYYAPDDFGLRIESHMVVVPSRHEAFLEFETISRLPIDPRLVDFRRLSPPERQWLADYHRLVLRDVEPFVDAASAAWLRDFVQAFVSPTETSAYGQ